jgi:hypothetical protein
MTDTVRFCEKWATNVTWPAPVDERLKALLEAAVEAGEAHPLSRSELLAALVCTAPADGDALRQMLDRYRRAKVGDIAIRPPGSDVADQDVIVLSERRPGRG